MDQKWRIELFGSLQAKCSDRTISRFRTRKTGSLLAYLAYYTQGSHPREELIEMLWPDCEVDAGRHSLSVALSSLRLQLEPPGEPSGSVIIADRTSIHLNPNAITTDVAEFEAAIRSARARDSIERAEFLTAAVGLYRDKLLAGYYEDWVLTERELLADHFLRSLLRLIAHLEQTGDFSGALELAHRAVAEDPLREELHRDVMRLYAALGEYSSALRAYRELERLLRAELDVSPEEATQELVHKIEDQQRLHPDVEEKPQTEPPSTSGVLSYTSLFPPAGIRETLPSVLSGTVTFLLMEIEGSTALGEQAGEASSVGLTGLQSLFSSAFHRHGGQVIRESGDAIWAAFPRATDAIAAAIGCNRVLEEHQSEVDVAVTGRFPLRARIVLHTGEIGPRDGGYFGPVVDRATRLLSAVHGEQLICSESTAALLSRDLEPGLRLMDLGVYRVRGLKTPERLFQIVYPGMAQQEFPPLKAEPGFQGNLPLQFTRFFGREEEIDPLQRMILAEGTCLVTITGPGGTGKTRLALEAARQVMGRMAGGVWFVQLADLSDPTLIAGTILDSMREDRSPLLEPMKQLINVLSREPALLVLDNFEHLTPGGLDVIEKLLSEVSALRCLVTSRHRLNIADEREFPLGPLPTPKGPDAPDRLILNDSVRLFIDRAQAVRPDFQATRSNAAALAELCNRLEGLPLALELAAARSQVMSPAQILKRLGERLDLFVNRRRGIPERHRTLRAAIDWSYRLLAPDLQQFFAKLSVFRGGWTLEAAEEICEEALAIDLLAELREGSMIMAKETELGMRFSMLETLREYAMEQLDPSDRMSLEQRHANFYVALAEKAEPELRGSKQAEWLARLSIEHDNLRAALEWSKANEPDAGTGLRLGNALCRFWYVRGHVIEGRKHLAEVLGRASEDTAVGARALNAAGILAYYQDDLASARAHYERSLTTHRRLEDKREIANLLNNLAAVTGDQGYHEIARSSYEEAMAIYQELGDSWGVACSFFNLGVEAFFEGDLMLARSLCEESLARLGETGDRFGRAHLLLNLGDVVRHQGDFGRARSLYEQSLSTYRELEHKSGIADCLAGLGKVSFELGDHAEARSLYEESLMMRMEIGGKQAIAVLLESVAALEEAVGKTERSASLFGAAAILRERLGIPLPPIEQPKQKKYVAALRDALGEPGFDGALERGRAMEWDKAVAFALGGV